MHVIIKEIVDLIWHCNKNTTTNKQTNKYEGFSAGRVGWWEQRPRGLFSTVATKDKRKVDHTTFRTNRPNSLIYENA